jgi:hypothetical protein
VSLKEFIKIQIESIKNKMGAGDNAPILFFIEDRINEIFSAAKDKKIFKDNSIIKCIDDSNTELLTNGNLYKCINYSYIDDIVCVADELKNNFFFNSSRFEIATYEEISNWFEKGSSDTIKSGDYVVLSSIIESPCSEDYYIGSVHKIKEIIQDQYIFYDGMVSHKSNFRTTIASLQEIEVWARLNELENFKLSPGIGYTSRALSLFINHRRKKIQNLY